MYSWSHFLPFSIWIRIRLTRIRLVIRLREVPFTAPSSLFTPQAIDNRSLVKPRHIASTPPNSRDIEWSVIILCHVKQDKEIINLQYFTTRSLDKSPGKVSNGVQLANHFGSDKQRKNAVKCVRKPGVACWGSSRIVKITNVPTSETTAKTLNVMSRVSSKMI